METTLPLPFLLSVAVPPGLAKLPGLNREEVSILGCPFFEAKSPLIEKFWRFLKRHNAEFHPHFDATAVESPEDVISLLDRGARRVFVEPSKLSLYEEYGGRVLPVVSTLDLSAATKHGLLINAFDLSTCDVEAFVKEAKEKKIENLFLKPVDGANLEGLIQVAQKANAVAVLPSTGLTTEKEDKEGRLQLGQVISSYWKSDRPDNLIPTVVCNEGGIALGLAYTSEESLGEAIRTQAGVYQSRKRGLWVKGLTSGDTQELVRISLDCDNDTLKFTVKQKGRFCHLAQHGCFGDLTGIAKLEGVLRSRQESAPEGSYTARLFSDEKLLRAKIMEEAEELCDAKTPEEVAFEAADLIYFALTRAVAAGVGIADIEQNLDERSWKVKRRKGDAKGKWAEKEGIVSKTDPPKPAEKEERQPAAFDRITMKRLDLASTSSLELAEALKRPSQKSPDAIMKIIVPIIDDVKKKGDEAVLAYTHKFEQATSLTTPVLKAPFPAELMELPQETIEAIDISFENIRKFHAAQKDEKPLLVETMPGVVCSRFSRPIEAVGLYIPGGTAVLPSTALMLGVPAMVAGCKKIVFASPPRKDGKLTPEVVYAAHKVGAESIVLAGGAQAVAAMAYGTESIPKVDKILGPGNQFVTAAKILVSNDANAGVAIDMPAGPSEVLVVADKNAIPAFVASDLLSQAEHGVDSQVILIAVDLTEERLEEIEEEVHKQAMALPRVDIVRGSIAHSLTVRVKDIEEAMRISNQYAPEHLILQVDGAAGVVDLVENAGSVFVGRWTPESVGDYSAGVNHSLRKFLFHPPRSHFPPFS